MGRVIRRILVGLLVLFILIQFIPYGRDHDNPPVVQEPVWDSAQTEALAERACYDCHSNETRWLWYHNIAPISWGVQRDVNEAREEMNFSRWDLRQDEAEDAAEMVSDGEMPPFRYVIAHPEANLSSADREALIQGLLATFGGDRGDGGGDNDNSGRGGDDDDNSGRGGDDNRGNEDDRGGDDDN